MATVILDTGILDTNPLQVGQAPGTNTMMPIESQIYPSAKNDDSLVSVQAGTMVVVTAYGASYAAQDDAVPLANVYKVLLAEPVTTEIVATCSLTPRVAEVTILGEAKICDLALHKCSPMVVLTVPGMYSIRPTSADLTITAMPHPITQNI